MYIILFILSLLTTESTPTIPPPTKFAVQSLQYTTHHVNLNSGDIQFTINVYDLYFDRSIYTVDVNNTIKPIASIHQTRLHHQHISPSIHLLSPSLNEDGPKISSVYIHRRAEIAVDDPTNDDDNNNNNNNNNNKRHHHSPLYHEHQRELNIFKSKRRTTNLHNHDNIIGPLAERIHRFIEEQTYHEMSPITTNGLRFGKLIRIYTKNDGLIYSSSDSISQAGETTRMGAREKSHWLKQGGIESDSTLTSIIQFPTIAEQLLQEYVVQMKKKEESDRIKGGRYKQRDEYEAFQQKKKHPMLQQDRWMLQIVDRHGNAPSMLASPIQNMACLNPLQPHLTHDIVLDTSTTMKNSNSNEKKEDVKDVKNKLNLYYTKKEKTRWINEIEIGGPVDVLSPATFINPVIESMLGQAIPR